MLSLLSSKLGRLAVLAVLAVVGTMLLADAGSAATRRLSGTYTAAQIKASCDAAPGGIYNNGPYGSGMRLRQGVGDLRPQRQVHGQLREMRECPADADRNCRSAAPAPPATKRAPCRRFLPPAG